MLSILLLSSIILPLLNIYGPHLPGPTWQTKLVYYFFIPILIIRYVFQQPLTNFGFQVGSWQLGLLLLISYILLKVLITPSAIRKGWLDYYRADNQANREKWRNYDPISLMAWEFFWRGYFLFGLLHFNFSPWLAMIIQTIPFTLMHFGKPIDELLSCLPGGLFFGLVAWSTRSALWPGLIHAFQQFWTFYQLGNLAQLFDSY